MEEYIASFPEPTRKNLAGGIGCDSFCGSRRHRRKMAYGMPTFKLAKKTSFILPLGINM
jgi:hypothetical protein